MQHSPGHGIHGDSRGAGGPFGALYTELHRLARREVYRQRPFGGLGATTLLHEAYLKMSGGEGAEFADRARFMACAARGSCAA